MKKLFWHQIQQAFLTTLSATSILFYCSKSLASEFFYFSHFCELENTKITLKNKTAEIQKWLAHEKGPTNTSSAIYQVSPRQTATVHAKDILQFNNYSIQILNNNSLEVRSYCRKQQHWLSVPTDSFSSPQRSHFFKALNSVSMDIFIENLSALQNNIELQWLDQKQKIIQQWSVHLNDKQQQWHVSLKRPANAVSLYIKGTERLHSLLVDQNFNFSSAEIFQPEPLQPSSEAVYFLAGIKNSQTAGSFTVAITDPAMIAQAREQIAKPKLEKIIVAGIQWGHGNHNRAWGSIDKSPYSWSVFRVDALADFAYIDC
ncbi:MAG: hypothetical protein ACOYOK_13890, partial [Pseudobdellovibrionaceae bacterium]